MAKKSTIKLVKGARAVPAEKPLSPNKRVLRALVIAGKEIQKQASNELGDSQDDPFSAAGKVIAPPFDPLVLAMLPENSTELVQVIEAMEVNIEGFGQRVIQRTMTSEQLEANKTEIRREKKILESLMEIPNAEEDMTSLRRKTRKDLETTGNGYWELLLNNMDKSKLEGINQVSSHTIRLIRQDTEFTKVEKRFLNENLEWETKIFFKRFRRYIQRSRGSNRRSFVYFKEWDDPRNIDKSTGEVAKAGSKNLATPMMHFDIYSPRTPYGLPRLIGNLFSIFGSRAADEINFTTFKNNNVPSMIISVSNGMLTEASISRVEEFVNSHIKRSDNYSKFLILEAESQTEDEINPGTMKINIDPMTDTQRDDQLFQEYDKNNADKIRRAYRLPPIFVGQSENINRATAEASRRLADEQVFAPERREIDRRINQILTQYGLNKFHFIKSNSPNITDDQILVKILANAEKTGAMSPAIGRKILEDVFGTDLGPVKTTAKLDPDIPFSLTMAEAVKNISGNPPTQGQVTGAEPNAPKLEVDKLVDALNNYESKIDQAIGIEIFGGDDVSDDLSDGDEEEQQKSKEPRRRPKTNRNNK